MAAPKGNQYAKENKGKALVKISAWLQACIEVLNECAKNKNTWVYTDDDLLFQINDKLAEEDQITSRTFEYWKQKAREGYFKELPDHLKVFFRLYKKALTIEKNNLLIALASDTGSWQRWAWILERKFPEWNLRKLTETEIKGKIENEFKFNLTVVDNEGKPIDFNFKTGDSVQGIK